MLERHSKGEEEEMVIIAILKTTMGLMRRVRMSRTLKMMKVMKLIRGQILQSNTDYKLNDSLRDLKMVE